ncbi:MAG: hypothetical protein R2709_02485 [Marmoricola sp.]
MNGVERVGLPWVSLMAFQRIITHPRVTTTPLTAEEAWIHVTDWLDTEQAWVPTPGARHRDILGSLLIDGDLRGISSPTPILRRWRLSMASAFVPTTVTSPDSRVCAG